METFELARFVIDPADADVLRERWRHAVKAIRERFPGLIEANLTRIDESTFLDVWRWKSHEAAMAAAAAAPDIPEAAAMFSLIISPPSMEHAQIVEVG